MLEPGHGGPRFKDLAQAWTKDWKVERWACWNISLSIAWYGGRILTGMRAGWSDSSRTQKWWLVLKYKLIYSLILDMVAEYWDAEMMVGSLQVLDGYKAFLQWVNIAWLRKNACFIFWCDTYALYFIWCDTHALYFMQYVYFIWCDTHTLCFMQYACFMLYAIRLFHALCDTPVSYFMRYACFMLYAKSLFYAKGLALGHI